MVELSEVFKASEEETMEDGIKPMEPGWYSAVITKSEFKETKSGNGQYLKLSFKIIENEDYKNRMAFTNLNLIHTNDTTVQIAKRELASICTALDLESVLDTEELHGNPLQIKLTIKPETPQWPAGNEIKGYRNIDVEGESAGDSSPFG